MNIIDEVVIVGEQQLPSGFGIYKNTVTSKDCLYINPDNVSILIEDVTSDGVLTLTIIFSATDREKVTSYTVYDPKRVLFDQITFQMTNRVGRITRRYFRSG